MARPVEKQLIKNASRGFISELINPLVHSAKPKQFFVVCTVEVRIFVHPIIRYADSIRYFESAKSDSTYRRHALRFGQPAVIERETGVQ